MATTKIWPVYGDLRHPLEYGANPEKTDARLWTEKEQRGLADVLDYGMQPSKTERELYVTGINCDPSTARQEMIFTKERWNKVKGIACFHGEQSFAPGETTPDIAHEIGVKLAHEMWGDSFEVVVMTHLDKAHLHTHFVVNSVSNVDGHKWRNNFNDYYRGIRAISDRLCKEYGLSVVKPGEKANSKHYAEWQAEKEGQDTWRSLIRHDIDDAISRCQNTREFVAQMKKMGYTLKTNVKHMAIKPPGKERFVRLRSLGPGYSEEDIERRLREPGERRAKHGVLPVEYGTRPTLLVLRIRSRRVAYKKGQIKGIRALYVHYLYRLGVIRKRPPPSARTAFLLKEDLRKLDRYVAQAKLLNEHRIDNLPQLQAHKQNAQARLSAMAADRQKAYTAKSQCSDAESAFEWATRAGQLTQVMKELRKEVKLCEQIEATSVQMQDRLDMVRDDERQRRNEAQKRRGGIEHGR